MFYIKNLQDEEATDLSEDCVISLQNLMKDSPLLTHTIIQKLTAVCANRAQNLVLYQVYITSAMENVSFIARECTTKNILETSDSQVQEAFGAVCQVLSLFEAPDTYLLKLKEHLSKLFQLFCRIT